MIGHSFSNNKVCGCLIISVFVLDYNIALASQTSFILKSQNPWENRIVASLTYSYICIYTHTLTIVITNVKKSIFIE